DSELLLCHGMVCVVGRMRDLILQLSKSSIYSTKPFNSQQITLSGSATDRETLTYIINRYRITGIQLK
ncbi:hypothetical protein LAX11_20145, partial [Escherichia coli]|nr:hypothetical protein [Escherichia coli]